MSIIRDVLLKVCDVRGIPRIKNMFGCRWWKGFQRRRGDLVVRNARFLHSRLPTRDQFNKWFNTLNFQFDMRNVDPSQLHNMDESWFDGRIEDVRVVGPRGKRGHVSSITKHSLRDHITLVVTCCADGSSHPIMWLWKAQRQLNITQGRITSKCNRRCAI
jgi:hypothetical protein